MMRICKLSQSISLGRLDVVKWVFLAAFLDLCVKLRAEESGNVLLESFGRALASLT